MSKYQPQEIEKKWQKKWEKDKLYEFKDSDRSKYYTLVELPYTSGDLHIGHWFTWTTADAHARYKKMKGLNVFFPHGYDAFGLPAENAAIKRGIHPKEWTYSNIENMTKQFRTMGSIVDLEHITVACDPEYYRWNQWIFIKMFEKGIAYRGTAMSNWCPKDQTVLADEHVEAGKCWRCGTIVEKKEVAQWFLRITAYADRLLWPEPVISDQKSVVSKNKKLKTDNRQLTTDEVDWPTPVRVGQNNWIGRSEGSQIAFKVQSSKFKVEVYTVFPETIFGVTYMVLAPEHELVSKITTPEHKKEVEKYVKATHAKSEQERKEGEKDKTGVFTGSYCINPVNGAKVPVWIADYVIASYGTGAVMGVPGSDHRDFEFAQKYKLPIIRVIGKSKEDRGPIASQEDVLEEGILVNSGEFSGQKTPEPGRENVKKWLEEKGWGKRKVQYHIRDWSVSRQRYWGTSVPIIYCRKCWENSVSSIQYSEKLTTDNRQLTTTNINNVAIIDDKEYIMHPVPLKDLPVELPDDVDFTPRGKAPLASNEKWLNVKCPNCGAKAQRDPETLDTFFDSSWYFYRYLDPKYEKGPFSTEKATKLMPVDIYFGGAEHTLGHTLYARFFTKFFKDLGLVTFDEFASIRIQHGVVLGPDGYRMSKSRGNVINPDSVVAEYGADAVRLYLSFMMAYEDTGPWSPGALAGVYRFLKRVWGLLDKVEKVHSSQFTVHSTKEPGDDNREPSTVNQSDLVIMNRTIKKVTEDLENIKSNTAVAAIMEFLNHLSRKNTVAHEEYKTLLLLLAPFAPHITEELWEMIGEEYSIHNHTWPEVDEKHLSGSVVKIPVQVDGKLRDVLEISAQNINEKSVVGAAEKSENVKKYLEGKKYKTVYVKGRLLNFVTS